MATAEIQSRGATVPVPEHAEKQAGVSLDRAADGPTSGEERRGSELWAV